MEIIDVFLGFFQEEVLLAVGLQEFVDILRSGDLTRLWSFDGAAALVVCLAESIHRFTSLGEHCFERALLWLCFWLFNVSRLPNIRCRTHVGPRSSDSRADPGFPINRRPS